MTKHTIHLNRIIFSVVLIVTSLISSRAFSNATAPVADLPKAEIMRLGERMYRDGILPSGTPMPAFIRGDVEVDSRAFSCSSCHLRAGLGSVEGGVVTPPTTGAMLYKPYRRPPSLDDIPDRAGRIIYARTVAERPAYTRDSLMTALRFGTDPAGETFNDVMPRYPLSDRDMSILISYLEYLSDAPSPGASDKGLAFATIITDDVSREDRTALLQPLQSFFAMNSKQAAMYDDFIRLNYTPTVDMKYSFRRMTHEVWDLKGPPETWQAQLAAYQKNKPVFAVLGGISNKDWRPIHEFCETERLPCLFPITDYPVVSASGWYTYYFNKGFAQEGDAAARYLNRMETVTNGTPILQLVQDSPAGRALATGFDTTWKELERPAVTTLNLTAKQLADPAELGRLLATHKPGVLLLWADGDVLPALPALTGQLTGAGSVFVSSGILGARTAAIPEKFREKVFITYPYRLIPFVGSKEGGFIARVPLPASFKELGERRIGSRTNTMLRQAAMRGLNQLQDNLFREHLLDIMGMQMDVIVRDYERFSFGPGQRFVSKGCYIMQLGPGPEPALIPRSEWVIH